MNNWELSKSVIEKHGAITLEIPESIFSWLKKAAFKAKEKKNDANKNLVGHIKEEYYFTETSEKFENFIYTKCLNEKNIIEHTKTLDILFKSAPFKLADMWVNFQKKHEFNPPHKHSGVYSFVIYLQIPFDLKKEEKLYPKLDGEDNNVTSKFAFLNTTPLGKIFFKCLNVDKSFEGKIIMFPAEQVHTVFPFYTSNDYRISISGNIRLYNEN